MLSLKKYLTEGLIQFTILLSLMGVRVDLDSYLPSHLPPLHEIILGPTSAYTQTQFHSLRGTSDGYGVHPKSVDLDQFFTSRRLLSRMRELDRLQVPSTELDAWLVHKDAESSVSSVQTGSSRSPDSPQDLPTSESSLRDSIETEQGRGEELGATAQSESSELNKEEVDPIDILWLQDIDLGAGREDFESRQHQKDNEDVWESLGDDPGSESVDSRVQVDGETGENVPQEGQTAMSLVECLSLLEDTFQFADSPEFPAPAPQSILDVDPCPVAIDQTDGLLSPFLPNLEMPLDLEEQWQDLMSIMDMQPMDINSSADDPLYLNLDPSLQQNETLDQVSLQGCSQNVSLYTPTMDPFPISESPLPQLSSHNSTDLNSTFGFTNITGILFPSQLNSTANETSSTILQDPLGGILGEALLDEISLMELALEEGFTQVQASQLQEELDSDSGLSLDSHRSPVSPSGSETSSSSSSSCSSSSFSEEGAVGYSSDSEMVEPEESEEASGYQPEYSKFCRMSSQNPGRFQRLPFLEHVGHNHTYNMMPEEPEEQQQSMMGRDSRRQTGFLDRQAGRDEQRARAMKIPFSNEKIINLPVEEFNELLTKYQLSDAQLCLVRDIRRRGKNKMAAQNCRKRKLDTILNLEHEVKRLSRERNSQLRVKGENLRSLQRMKQEVENLYQEVFSQLRDQEGRAYSPQRYALHYTSNGNVVLMPRNAEGQQSQRPERKDRRK